MWVINNSELFHYGIKGMKWGKAKNYGTMTAAQGRAAEAAYRRNAAMAEQVVKGNYGNGKDRQERLGRDYYDVQSMVNRHIKGRDINPGNYATSGESSKEYSERKAKEFREKVQNDAARRRSTEKIKSSTNKESGDGKSKAYNRGYALVKKLLGKRKR